MAKSLLLELGMEEVPARFIRGAAEQLQDKLTNWLDHTRITYKDVKAYATPRRIAVIAEGVSEKQAELSEEAKGPALKIARDADGNWTKAALGFARSQGVQPDELYTKEIANVAYVFAKRSGAGALTAELLPAGLKEIIQAMSFPKNMRWAAHELSFVRPIRWLTVLFGEEIVPLEIAGVKSGRTSKGHRFMGRDAVIDSPKTYVERLRAQSVIVDMEERKQLILSQINQLAEEKNWRIAIKDDLLEEVLFLVEYPTALYGTFDPSFLHIPQDVLITSMREHQRYFPVLDASGDLLPYFVTVRNGDSSALDIVARGNEKVLRARLSDAKFFYEEDQKLPIDAALSRLETIVFHEKLGSIGDKVRRIEALSERISTRAKVSEEVRNSVTRAAHICKFDLVTQMVYEFPELQGVMGEDYARKQGESEAVARAVNEHYQPRHAGDQVPSEATGAIVSLADKLDTITGCFSIGIIPTGSADPYALRRQAAGIVHILLEYEFPTTLDQLIQEAMEVHQSQRPLQREMSQVAADVLDFFALRVKNVLSDKVRYDIAEAVMESGIVNVPAVVRKAEALAAFVNEKEAKLAMDAFNRVCNLAQKAEQSSIDRSLFTDPIEEELYKQWEKMHKAYMEQLQNGDAKQALAELAGLKDTIHRYFDQIMVMADDPKLRASRLAMLKQIADDILQYADFSRIVW